MSCVKDERKSAFLSDSLLGRRELKQKIVFTKIIKATTNLNSYFGEGKFSRTQLWERVNCYLEKDSFKSICLRTFLRYLKKLNNLSVDSQYILSSGGKGLGEKRGAYFAVALSEEAHYLVNKFFYSLKLSRLKDTKLSRLSEKKVTRQLVYLKNRLTSPLSYKPKESLRSSQSSRSLKEKGALVSTERFLDKSFLGTGAYKQALKDLEGMEVSREHTIEIERILINSIAKENATLNLRDFLKDLEPDKRQSGVQVYLRELKALKGSMRLMRKGSQKYTKMLEEVLHPPKKLSKKRYFFIKEEEREELEEYDDTPMTQEEADEMRKRFLEEQAKRKELEKNNKALGVFPMYGNEFVSIELDSKRNSQYSPRESSQGDFLKLPPALSVMNQILKKE